MNKELMHGAIEKGRAAEAVAMAVLHDPGMLVDELDHHRITQDAQPYWDFAQEWIAAARVLVKPSCLSTRCRKRRTTWQV